MRLKFENIEVEGKNEKEIDALLKRAQSLIKELKPKIPSSFTQEYSNKFVETPKGNQYTVLELSEKIGISTASTYMKLKAMESNGQARIVGKKKSAKKLCTLWEIDIPVESILMMPQSVETKKQKQEKFNVDLDKVPD